MTHMCSDEFTQQPLKCNWLARLLASNNRKRIASARIRTTDFRLASRRV